MASNAERQKKRREKLAEQGYQEVSIRIKQSTLDQLDAIAKRVGTSRSAVLSRIFEKLSSAGFSQS